MDNRPIGIFDSGLGGLSAVKEIRRLLPNENLVYFGDTGRTPYGTRSKATIEKYAGEDTAFLQSQNVKAIVIACGTVSSVAIDYVRQLADMPVIGVIDKTSEEAALSTKNKKIGVMGTSATVKSGIFKKKIHSLDENIEIISAACPLLVPIVENGFIGRDNEIAYLATLHYMREILLASCDTVILGCTHFPLLCDTISRIAPDIIQINSGAAAAHELMQILLDNTMLADKEQIGTTRYYVSDTPHNFEEVATLFLGGEIGGSVEKINIEGFSRM